MSAIQGQPLPKWLRRAIRDQVISEQEARLMQWYREAADLTPERLYRLPPNLYPAAQRMFLWEVMPQGKA